MSFQYHTNFYFLLSSMHVSTTAGHHYARYTQRLTEAENTPTVAQVIEHNAKPFDCLSTDLRYQKISSKL
jgi:hypothetical protein